MSADSSLRLPILKVIKSLCNAAGAVHSQVQKELLEYYHGTTERGDVLILSLLKLGDYKMMNLRTQLRRWAPPSLKVESDITGPSILTELDDNLVFKACLYLLKPLAPAFESNDERTEVGYDPVFILGIFAQYLDNETIDPSGSLALCHNNALGVAVCALASYEKSIRFAGDRVLAKTYIKLSVSLLTDIV